MYNITQYTLLKAKQMGLRVTPSKDKKFKLDVYNNSGKYLASVGDSKYKDYPTYVKENGNEYAEKRRKLYKSRHEKDRHVVGSRGYYADQLLW